MNSVFRVTDMGDTEEGWNPTEQDMLDKSTSDLIIDSDVEDDILDYSEDEANENKTGLMMKLADENKKLKSETDPLHGVKKKFTELEEVKSLKSTQAKTLSNQTKTSKKQLSDTTLLKSQATENKIISKKLCREPKVVKDKVKSHSELVRSAEKGKKTFAEALTTVPEKRTRKKISFSKGTVTTSPKAKMVDLKKTTEMKTEVSNNKVDIISSHISSRMADSALNEKVSDPRRKKMYGPPSGPARPFKQAAVDNTEMKLELSGKKIDLTSSMSNKLDMFASVATFAQNTEKKQSKQKTFKFGMWPTAGSKHPHLSDMSNEAISEVSSPNNDNEEEEIMKLEETIARKRLEQKSKQFIEQQQMLETQKQNSLMQKNLLMQQRMLKFIEGKSGEKLEKAEDSVEKLQEKRKKLELKLQIQEMENKLKESKPTQNFSNFPIKYSFPPPQVFPFPPPRMNNIRPVLPMWQRIGTKRGNDDRNKRSELKITEGSSGGVEHVFTDTRKRFGGYKSEMNQHKGRSIKRFKSDKNQSRCKYSGELPDDLVLTKFTESGPTKAAKDEDIIADEEAEEEEEVVTNLDFYENGNYELL